MEIDVKIFCECGAELEHYETKYIAPGGWVENGEVNIIVKPCETCIEKEGEKEYKRGHNDGYDSVGG